MKMKTDIKRLMILRDSYVREREKRINDYEEKVQTGETEGLGLLSEIINILGAKINDIDEKIGGRNGVD